MTTNKPGYRYWLRFWEDGISIIPLVGKQAAHNWRMSQNERAERSEIQRWMAHPKSDNIGIVCGGISRNLVVIDLDGLDAVEAYQMAFPTLLDTFYVATGSGKGMHYYYRVDELPRTTRVLNALCGGNIEIRADGCYVVGAGGIHPDTGNEYRIMSNARIRQLSSLKAVLTWANKQRRQQPKATSPAASSSHPKAGSSLRTMRFATAALADEIRILQTTPHGQQNHRLNVAAYNLGQLVGDGLLERFQVEDALFNTAMNSFHDKDMQQHQNTIQSGLEAGIRNPRSQQWHKRNH